MKHFAQISSVQTHLLSAQIISIEVDVTFGTQFKFNIVGLPDKAVEESGDRVSSALKNSGFTAPKHSQNKTLVSLAPADIRKEGPNFDVPIALAYLLATNGKKRSDDEKLVDFDPKGKMFVGELSLDGKVRPIKGTLLLAQRAQAEGFTEIYVPKANAEEAALVEGITVYPIQSLMQVVEHLNILQENRECIAPQPKTQIKDVPQQKHYTTLDEIKGQESAKRGLEIAAAGGHNIALFGPPGTGKTMLAKAFSGLIPSLSLPEALEVTGIHSTIQTLNTPLVTQAPFRAPHHTASYVSLVGGGSIPKPGEVTLAHRGVLFLDEFPEFDKKVLDALRQPLEDGVVSISRARGSAEFPSNFILIAAMNPCPCGYFGTDKCTCSPLLIQKYTAKISGPIMDRIDMWIKVGQIDHKKLSEKATETTKETDTAKKNILNARIAQTKRFSKEKNTSYNSDMSAKQLSHYAPLCKRATRTLNQAAQSMNLSPRAYHRVIKLARTIADLKQAEDITEGDILEALGYRPKKNS